MNKRKILCIGDSLALPRGDDVSYEETWYFKLKQQFSDFDFYSIFKRGVTTNILVQWGGGDINNIERYPFGSDCLEHFKPNVVILQLGIVDCAPRLLKQGIESALVNRLPLTLRNYYIRFLKKYRGRKKSNTYVSLKRFKNNLSKYIERCEKQNLDKLIIIKIGIPTNEMISKNPNIIENINNYNAVYEELSKQYSFVKCISPLILNESTAKIYVDGYHPNPVGNELVYKVLKRELLNV